MSSTTTSRCLHCAKPTCKTGCPIHMDIPRFLAEVEKGNFSQATSTVDHLFGEICGYVCAKAQQCQGHCILQKKGCGIDVGMVEKQVFSQHFPTLQRRDAALKGVKAAVVGGGVSGVTFAEQCFKHGAEVTVFEKNDVLHTLQSIPSFRLPREAIHRVISAIQGKIKVENVAVDNIMLDALTGQFDVVYLATGVHLPNKLWISGEDLSTSADAFLRGNTFGNAIVVGGGNTALDCARLNVRQGNPTTIAYRRQRADMPAFETEIERAEKEQVQFCFNLQPMEINKEKNGLAVTFARTISQGRQGLVVTEERVTLFCDVLVVASGNKFDKSVFDTDKFVSVDETGLVKGNLYAGGDAIGHSLVAEAVADGINAAKNVLARYKR